MSSWRRVAIAASTALIICVGGRASAQTIESITFEEAIRRATANNPGIQQAAAGILRAEALLSQVRSRLHPSVQLDFSASGIEPVATFDGASVTPRVQTVTSGAITIPILSSVRWAEREQAADQVLVSQASAADVRRQIAMATAEAYLMI